MLSLRAIDFIHLITGSKLFDGKLNENFIKVFNLMVGVLILLLYVQSDIFVYRQILKINCDLFVVVFISKTCIRPALYHIAAFAICSIFCFFFITACTDLYRCWRECMVSHRRESNLVDSIRYLSDRTCATFASTHPSSQSPFLSCSGTPFHWRHLRLLCHALPAESCCCSCLWHSCWRGRKCCARSSKAVP